MPVSINSDTGNIYAGGDGSDGDLVLRSSQGTNRVHLDAGGGNGWVRRQRRRRRPDPVPELGGRTASSLPPPST